MRKLLITNLLFYSSYWIITAATLQYNQRVLIILHGINYSMKMLTSFFSNINCYLFIFIIILSHLKPSKMKTRVLLSMLHLFFTAASFAQNKMQLVGTWKLISGKATQDASTFPYDNKTLDAIKIVTPTHFAVFSQKVSDTAFQHASTGTAEMDDKNYTEHLLYDNNKDMVGKTAKFTYRLEGDKWYIKGKIDNMVMLEEVWQRVK